MDMSVAGAAESILLLENAALPLVLALPNGKITFTNRAYRDALGYDDKELIGRSLLDLADEPDEVLRERIRLAATSIDPIPERSVLLVRKDGTRVRCRASSIVIRDQQGEPVYLLARVVPERLADR